MNKKDLGMRLRAVRKHLSYTQAVMAAELGITLYALREIEDGNLCITVEIVNKLAALGFNRDYFLEYNAAMVA